MAAAAIQDALRFRISNLTSLVVLAGAIAAAAIAGPSWSLWQNATVLAVILALGTVAFSAGWLGGGDVKLLAAAGLWFDLRSALWFLAVVFISGGVVAICYLLTRPFRRSAAAGKMGKRVPYGVAIAIGAAAMILLDHGNIRDQSQQGSPLRNVRIGG